MAPSFPLPLLRALDVAARAFLPLALQAEATLAGGCSPHDRAAALATLERNGQLRRQRRAAAGPDDALAWDGCSGDAGDVGEGGAS